MEETCCCTEPLIILLKDTVSITLNLESGSSDLTCQGVSGFSVVPSGPEDSCQRYSLGPEPLV